MKDKLSFTEKRERKRRTCCSFISHFEILIKKMHALWIRFSLREREREREKEGERERGEREREREREKEKEFCGRKNSFLLPFSCL